MKALKNPTQVQYYGKLIGEMMRAELGAECDFDDEWVRRRSWNVVPVESAMRLPAEDISRFVSAFRQAGHKNCIAVFNEAGYLSRLPVLVESDPPGDLATCYVVDIDETDF